MNQSQVRELILEKLRPCQPEDDFAKVIYDDLGLEFMDRHDLEDDEMILDIASKLMEKHGPEFETNVYAKLDELNGF